MATPEDYVKFKIDEYKEYTRPGLVTISKAENGFIITMGGKTFVAPTWNEVWVSVGTYFAVPLQYGNIT